MKTLLLLFVLVSPVGAQDTRTEVITQQQTDKAATARAYEPTKAERIFIAVKRELIDAPSGLYPLVGSVYGGGGLALGGGYRRYYGDRTYWDGKGLWSIRNYKFAEVSTGSPGDLQGRVDLDAHLSWRDATKVAFHGIGMTPQSGRTNFRFEQVDAGAAAKIRPIPWVVLKTGLSFEDYTLKKGLGQFPSIEERYTAVTAPGLGTNPTYVHSAASVAIDWRRAEGYARRGGLYEIGYDKYADSQETHSFDRLHAEIVQHLPLLRENWVLSGHARVESTLNDADTPVYFLLPALGSADTLRGYSASRFRDRHSVLVQGEFRWIPNRNGLDMAIFYDAGKVTNLREEINLKGLKSDVGAEVRFHGPTSTPLRLGIALSNEGWHIVFGGSAAF